MKSFIAHNFKSNCSTYFRNLNSILISGSIAATFTAITVVTSVRRLLQRRRRCRRIEPRRRDPSPPSRPTPRSIPTTAQVSNLLPNWNLCRTIDAKVTTLKTTNATPTTTSRSSVELNIWRQTWSWSQIITATLKPSLTIISQEL
jgi:hypothetical protein